MTGNHVAFGDSALGRARVTFTEFRSADDPMLRAWVRFRGSLATHLASAAAVRNQSQPQPQPQQQQPTPTPAVGRERPPAMWRLLATNNRELGRSFVLYGSFDAAHAHVTRLQHASAELEVAIITGPLNASRGWVILHEGSPVMTCGRWYSSASTGIAAGAGALAAIPRAAISDDADRSAPSGRLSRRSPG